jgi:hypothetical protein
MHSAKRSESIRNSDNQGKAQLHVWVFASGVAKVPRRGRLIESSGLTIERAIREIRPSPVNARPHGSGRPASVDRVSQPAALRNPLPRKPISQPHSIVYSGILDEAIEWVCSCLGRAGFGLAVLSYALGTCQLEVPCVTGWSIIMMRLKANHPRHSAWMTNLFRMRLISL